VEAFRSPDPSQDGRQVKVADVLERAGGRLDREFAGTQATRGALLSALGHTYRGLGLYHKAVSLHAKARDVREAALGSDHSETLSSRNDLAKAYSLAGQLPEAIALHEGTLKLSEVKLGPDHPDTLGSRNNLAEAYELLGRWAEAEVLYRDNLAHRRKTAPPESPLLARGLAALGRNLLIQLQWSKAEPLLREGLAIRERATPDDWQRFSMMSLLGGSLLGQARHSEAEPLLIQGYDGMKARADRIGVPDMFHLREAAERIIRLYEDWGKRDQAAAWRTKLGMAVLPADVFAPP
jgi:eukaryotic-like serine/threonine-protein kinase